MNALLRHDIYRLFRTRLLNLFIALIFCAYSIKYNPALIFSETVLLSAKTPDTFSR